MISHLPTPTLVRNVLSRSFRVQQVFDVLVRDLLTLN